MGKNVYLRVFLLNGAFTDGHSRLVFSTVVSYVSRILIFPVGGYMGLWRDETENSGGRGRLWGSVFSAQFSSTLNCYWISINVVGYWLGGEKADSEAVHYGLCCGI